MKRQHITEICNREVIETAAQLFSTNKEALRIFPDHEGCQNLVYEYDHNGSPMILRISFRQDRAASRIQAELHFINYLADHGVRVSKPVLSQDGNLVETIQTAEMPFHIASFHKGRGMRVPDNGYRYRDDAPIEEYFRNWGRTLGQMHATARSYQPVNDTIKRPDWSALHKPELRLSTLVAGRLAAVRDQIEALLAEITQLPKDQDCYALIHGDFNDGNFTVDYTNGDITIFDFDDCCYFWFIYELASAWEGGIGRIMFANLKQRKEFMDRYFDQVMEGYSQQYSLSDQWLRRLPLFLKLIHVEEFLYFVKYIDAPDEGMQAELNYRIKCITEDIPYLGFFDSIYSPERPFSL